MTPRSEYVIGVCPTCGGVSHLDKPWDAVEPRPQPEPEHTVTGRTRDGHDIEIRHTGDYRDAIVIIDGQQRKVVWADRLRDGGTTIYHLEDGKLTLPHRLGDSDRTPIWRPA